MCALYQMKRTFFKRFYLLIFREREREGERERNINMWLPLMRPLLGTWSATQACALDWESHWRPFGSQACTESSELHQPGLTTHLLFKLATFQELSGQSHVASGYCKDCLVLENSLKNKKKCLFAFLLSNNIIYTNIFLKILLYH